MSDSSNIQLVPWATIKASADANGFAVRYIDDGGQYRIFITSDGVGIYTVLSKDSTDTNDLLDFENNYKSAATTALGQNRYVAGRLKVDSAGVTTIAGGCPTISNKFSVDHWDGSDVALTSAFTEQYRYDGSGDLIGFMFDFNSDKVEIQLKIDGVICFTITLKELENLQSFNSNGCNDSGTNALIMPLSKTSGDRVNFKPDCPIKFNSSVVVEARETSGNRKLQRYVVYLVKAS